MDGGKQQEPLERTKLVDDCLEKTGSLYKLVVLAAKRAVDLINGSPKLAETSQLKPALVALEEIRKGLVRFHRGDESTEGKPS